MFTRKQPSSRIISHLAALLLGVNQLCINNLCGSVADIVHTLNPQHLVFCFKLLGYAFFFGKLVYQPKEHILCLLVNVSEIGGQLTACQ